MSQNNRPLSPHLQIYKPQITSVLSIFHRFTGIGLVLGLPILVWFLCDLAFGDLNEGLFATVMLSSFGKILLGGWTFCLAFHFCNGIRHLLWDIGWGFDLPAVHRTGWVVIFASFIMTGVVWVWIACRGGLCL